MIDLHCHLLPGIDDGPATLEEALEMARIAVANGIEEACVTPHLHPGRWENDLAKISAAAESYRVALAEERHASRFDERQDLVVEPHLGGIAEL